AARGRAGGCTGGAGGFSGVSGSAGAGGADEASSSNASASGGVGAAACVDVSGSAGVDSNKAANRDEYGSAPGSSFEAGGVASKNGVCHGRVGAPRFPGVGGSGPSSSGVTLRAGKSGCGAPEPLER